MSKITVTTIAGATSGGDANKVKIESGDTLHVDTLSTLSGSGNITSSNALLAPSIGGNSDTNTSVSFPGSDIVQLNNAGTARHKFHNLNGTSLFEVQPSSTGGSGAGGAFLKFKGSNGTPVDIASIDGSMTNGTATSESGILSFFTMNSGTNSEKMRIDSVGRVTIPNTPAFRANRTAGNYTSAVAIVWNNVIYNRGSHYDNSNGRFTAPVAGVYQFNVMGSVTANPANAGIHRVRINGNYQADLFPIATSSASHITYANSFMLNLSANDYVDVVSPGGSVQWYGTANTHNHFSGFLVG